MKELESDKALLAEIRRGNRTALASLYDRYADSIHAYLCSWRGNADGSEDLLQELFMSLLRKPDALTKNTDIEYPKAWLFGAARNLAVSARRAEKRRQDAIPEIILNFHCENEGENNFSDVEIGLLKTSFQTLEASQRELIHLHVWESMSFRELEEILGKPKSTLNREFLQAVEALKQKWKIAAGENKRHE